MKTLILLLENPLRLSVVVVIVLFLVALISQVLIPVLTDRPMFPWLSRKPKILGKIRDVNEELDEDELLAKLEELQASRAAKTAQADPEPIPRPKNPKPPTSPPTITAITINKPKPFRRPPTHQKFRPSQYP